MENFNALDDIQTLKHWEKRGRSAFLDFITHSCLLKNFLGTQTSYTSKSADLC